MARAVFRLLAVILPLATSVASAAGLAHSDNFVVLAANAGTAEQVLEKAEYYRRCLAIQWFGEELPVTANRTLISVVLNGKTTHAEFWALDGSQGKRFKLDLVNQPGGVIDAALAHEISHLVMEVKFGGRLPIWANEGLATFHTEHSKRVELASLMKAVADTGQWPSLSGLLDADRIDEHDRTSYTAAASLTSCLLQIRDVDTYFRFAIAGQAIGWQQAARTCYGVSLEQLELAWRDWTVRTVERGDLLAVISPPSEVTRLVHSAVEVGR